jgi:hypothetical protein
VTECDRKGGEAEENVTRWGDWEWREARRVQVDMLGKPNGVKGGRERFDPMKTRADMHSL